MKTRSGFVSNSSSSSFIVAFPRKPSSVKDVLEFMFHGKEGGVGLDYYDEGLTYEQVCKIVYENISLEKAKEAGLKEMIEQLSGRYYYSKPRHHSRIPYNNNCWGEAIGRYFGSNPKLMKELAELEEQHEEEQYESRKNQEKLTKEFLSKRNVIVPPYAYKGGTDPITKKPYTEKQVQAYESYQKIMEELYRSKEYKEAWDDGLWNKIEKLRKKIAEHDAKNFLSDNQGKFIFEVEYSDNDSFPGGLMEHGRIFRNVPHIKISHH